MKITVLTAVEAPDPSDDDLDVVVGQVSRALKKLGHSVSVLAIYSDVGKMLDGLSRRKPDLVFNMAETFGDSVMGDMLVAAILESQGYRYTGGGPGELYLSQDKGLSKKLLEFEGILYPRFAVFSRAADFETGGNLRMPLFVKPLRADSSIGIGAKSLVHDTGSLMKQVDKIHRELEDAALAEEYIEGREFFVSIVGNVKPQALPPVEVDFTGFPKDQPKILDSRAKWNEASKEYKGTRSVIADIPDELRAKLQKVSIDAYRALRVRDYGRVDLRLTETGEIYVLEVNASCYLEEDSELAMAAKAAGIEYPALIEKIVAAAERRYGR
ncbi:MAG TPA: ATP-grasp domain-containing protein [Gemmatimonadales bacterium]|nr:ATP-grasp domain-containing protein [Gemmatimonadales bacterium]